MPRSKPQHDRALMLLCVLCLHFGLGALRYRMLQATRTLLPRGIPSLPRA